MTAADPLEPTRDHMTESPSDYVDVTTEGGVITARIRQPNVEEHEASIILDRLREAMEKTGSDLQAVVLDFGEVTFINSSGLAACIEVRNGAAAKGAQTILYRPREDVSNLFRMVKVDRLYTFANDAQELKKLVSP